MSDTVILVLLFATLNIGGAVGAIAFVDRELKERDKRFKENFPFLTWKEELKEKKKTAQ